MIAERWFTATVEGGWRVEEAFLPRRSGGAYLRVYRELTAKMAAYDSLSGRLAARDSASDVLEVR